MSSIGTPNPQSTQAMGARHGSEYLTFTLGTEEYGIDILKVQEIRSVEKVTHIVNAPAFIKGVINLRGVIVPIVDLRLKFSLGEAEFTAFTSVVILNVANRVVGVIVDSVSDVVHLSADQIKAPPQFSSMLDVQFIEGLTSIDERMFIIMDIEALMSSQEMALVDRAA
jgi:purine-binding chemotaxis protein CheW